MSEERFHKSLECSCLKDVGNVTCPGGGEIKSLLSVQGAALFAEPEAEAKISSPGKCYELQLDRESYSGSGPYVIVGGCTAGDDCDFIADDWQVKVTYNTLGLGYGYGGDNNVTTTAEVINVYEDGTLLIFSTDLPDSEDELTSIISIVACGCGLPTGPEYSRTRALSQEIVAVGDITKRLSARFAFNDLDLEAEGDIVEDLIAEYVVNENVNAEGELNNTLTDKVNGPFPNYECVGKLFPSGDIPIASGFGSFTSKYKGRDALFEQIDEGVYYGIMKDLGDSITIADDDATFIHPDTIHTSGLFQYSCELTEFRVRPEETNLRIRASAPMFNLESRVAPIYTVYNIRFEDPSGNLIVKYNDFTVIGDSDEEHPNYTTYVTTPEINLLDKPDWERLYKPHLNMVSGYKLTFSVYAQPQDDAFTEGFDAGFEEYFIYPDIVTSGDGSTYLALDGQPLSTQNPFFVNPTDGFRITALEICNSGGLGPARESYLPFYAEVDKKGKRLERCFKPNLLQLYNFNTGIYPSAVTTLWEDSSDASVQNDNICDAIYLNNLIRHKGQESAIKLSETSGGGIADSGKLTLRFGPSKTVVNEIQKGAFNVSFDQGTATTWWQPSGAFDVENSVVDHEDSSIFFDADTITLKVAAKKQAGTRDYVLDVVGYSDDKLLNRTSPSGGFVQNPSGVFLNDTFVSSIGDFPVISGFSRDNSLALDGRPMSTQEGYYAVSGDDHYKLTQYPYVTGTDFEVYEVPLVITDEAVQLGIGKDYSLSSFLEHLYLDIFPLPSGAEIAWIELCARYAPANALNFYSQGAEKFAKAQAGRTEGSLSPTSMGSVDDILNAGSGYGPVSEILGLPHAYSSPDTIKANYSRRWRGVNGVVRGPFDPDGFGFAYENPTMDYPFASGYFTFDDVQTGYYVSKDLGPEFGTVSGEIVGDVERHRNLGWRFASGTIFQDQLPGYSGRYTSSDWTALSNGAITFEGNPMYGKIADAFDYAVRISGDSTQHINFGNINTASGFSIFARFTPDANVSGIDYDLFDSGVIYAKWGSAGDLDFALAYSGGYLCGYAQDDLGNIISVSDNIPFSGYIFPVSTLLTYNDNQSSGLKLYVDNEIYKGQFGDLGFDESYGTPYVLRASSDKFLKNDTSADLLLGWGNGSGVGMNMLVSEFGISTWTSGVDTMFGSGTNVVETNADRTYKQVTADEFLENIRVSWFNPNDTYSNDRYKLWDRVNEDTYNDWTLGDFHHCEFNFEFSELGSAVGKRPNYEYAIFDINHHGSGYIQNADLAMPSSVDSGVAYHTQIENDFLRFHLTDAADSFYAVNKRITKNLPTGYKFSERAIVVESIITHESSGDLVWSGCDPLTGPKFIVSLYTELQEPQRSNLNEPNWGLVNRRIHYLEPSSCLIKLDSTFTYDDICEDSEAWSIFPEEPRTRDFSERYFSDDVEKMFVQYDLVYPSGSEFSSKIELHSSHVRMEEANVCAVNLSGQMNLFSSGAFHESGFLDLNIHNNPKSGEQSLDLLMNLPIPFTLFDNDNDYDPLGSGLVMNISGGVTIEDAMTLFIPINNESIGGPLGDDPFTLNISGAIPNIESGILNLSLPESYSQIDSSNDGDTRTTPNAGGSAGPGRGSGPNGGAGGGDPAQIGFNLMLFNGDTSFDASGTLPLRTIGSDATLLGVPASELPLLLYNKIRRSSQSQSASGDMRLRINGFQGIGGQAINTSFPLFISAPNTPSENLNLYVQNEPTEALDSGILNLVTASYPVGSKGFGSSFGLWNNLNYGTGIELEDNNYSALDLDNEIRGVTTMGYGTCTGNSPQKVIEKALRTDCVNWRESGCVEGGIFRAFDTYTNSGAINFNEGSFNSAFDDELDTLGIGYSGNYYGIRKYTQLLPSLPYNAVMTIKTGNTDPINVPRTFEEWEYGMCGPAWDAEGCCTEDCDQNIVFSGVKFISDDAGGAGNNLSHDEADPALLTDSGRHIDEKYGANVSVRGDLMAIAAPNKTIPDHDRYRLDLSDPVNPVADPGTIDVSGAGAVYLYRRGDDVAGKKAPWTLEKQVMLPSGFRKDYVQRTVQNLLTFDTFSISGQKWQVGQEGRQFGESLAVANSGDKEILVVGAPRAKWNRQFTDIVTSGLPVGTMVVADLFQYKEDDLAAIRGTAKRYDILWKYFSAPWYGGTPDEFQPQIDNKIIVLQTTFSNKTYPQIPQDNSDWFVHKYINRVDDFDLCVEVGSGLFDTRGVTGGTEQQFFTSGQPIVFNTMFSGVKDAFFEAFPSGNNTVLYSGLPAILGFFKEQSASTLGGLSYTDENGDVQRLYDKIEQFYVDHTSVSGVFDQITGLANSGHLNTVEGVSENWSNTTRDLIRDTFDSGRLATTFTNDTLNQFFITSGVGQEWGEAKGEFTTEFQIPPASGGRVFIFENERGNLNCTQVIVSPNDSRDLFTDPADNENYSPEGDGEYYLGDTYGKRYNDRFGHSVDISENADILTIGSPFLRDPCRIYERDESENDKVYAQTRNWSTFRGRSDYEAHYDDILAQSGATTAGISTYDYMSEPDRFEFRNDVDFWNDSNRGGLPQTYKLTYKYSYGDISYVGTRDFIPAWFAPTSRLGWSTAVSEDGDMAVFGAPTDSFNEFEDSNVYGNDDSTWASYVHAGAVRAFKARRFYDHDGVVEFTRFGNLDRNTHKTERDLGFYDQMGLYFSANTDGTTDYQGHPFRRTEFSEIEIPESAGLAFIITPEADAASDEIIDNIKNWLALGDRNLVLVGNDPIWEENGLYEESNDIINKILEKLGSRMRITAAETEERSLPECLDNFLITESGHYNITAANGSDNVGVFGHLSKTISTQNYFAKGVGDIKIDLSKDNLSSYVQSHICSQGASCGDEPPAIPNEECNPPLSGNLGSLRAQWTTECTKTVPNVGCTVKKYSTNWPLLFGNYVPDCDDPPTPLLNKPGEEPVPLLTTAEFIPPVAWYVPESSGFFYDLSGIYEWVVKEAGSTSYEFGDPNGVVQFEIYENENSVPDGKFGTFDVGTFFDPDAKNTRDGLIQAVGEEFYPSNEERTETRELYPESILAITESGRVNLDNTTDSANYNNSRVYLIGTQWSEDDASRGIDGQGTGNDDKNTEFYINLLTKECGDTNPPRGIHIGGWTGNNGLNDAYFGTGGGRNGHTLANKLKAEFTRNGGFFQENQIFTGDDVLPDVDFVWIAQPEEKASAEDMARISQWMNQGNKTLVLTYNAMNSSTAQKYAENIDHLCSGLYITSRPFFVPSKGEYHTTDQIIQTYRKPGFGEEDNGNQAQKRNLDTIPFSGCEDGYAYTETYNFDTVVSGVDFNASSDELYGNYPVQESFGNEFTRKRFVPISGGQSYEKVLWFANNITDTITILPTNRWKIDANAQITFPQVVKDSGYRLYMNWVSETAVEEFDICASLDGASPDADPDSDFSGFFGGNPDESPCEINLDNTLPQDVAQFEVDFRAIGDDGSDPMGDGNLPLTINFDTSEWAGGIPRELVRAGVTPTTPRLLSVSGVQVPIITTTTTTRSSGLKLKELVRVNERWEVYPAQSGFVPGFMRPVKTDESTRYCPDDDVFSDPDCSGLRRGQVEDGPIIAAEEFEGFSSFPAGQRRSKIILITDSTMIQGQCPHYRSSATEYNQEFIRSLYPPTPSEALDGVDGFEGGYESGDDYETYYDGGRRFYFAQKIRAPEIGSPPKYMAVSGATIQSHPMIHEPAWGGAGNSSAPLSNFVDNEDRYDPDLKDRPFEIKDPEQIKQKIKQFYNSALSEYGMFPRFSGDFLDIVNYQGGIHEDYDILLDLSPSADKNFLLDADRAGGMNELMKLTNHDYLDIDIYYSGCIGDLFGWSVDLTNNNLVVGTPFNGYYTEGAASGVSGIVQWHEIENDPSRSGMRVGFDGGAGAAFVYDLSFSGENFIEEFLPFEFNSKIKPSSLNVGIIDFSPSPIIALERQRGPHTINDPNYILEYAKRSDQFGYDVSVDCDMIAVGAPNHDFETLHHYIYSGSVVANELNTAFLRKSFNAAFDIPLHSFYDLGSSGVRVDDFGNTSGVMILNGGAVYNYRNEMLDFQQREQYWVYADKLDAEGYQDRVAATWTIEPTPPFDPIQATSGAELSRFGQSVSIDRAFRGDSDYTLVIGSPDHTFPTSGDHPTGSISGAGAGYTFDAMLREQVPSVPSSSSWLDAHVFGNKKSFGDQSKVQQRVYQNETGDSQTVLVSGLVFTNYNGDVFIEVSGYDGSTQGFASQRPYVEKIEFVLANATEENNSMNLFVSGQPVLQSGDMNLTVLAPSSAIVYNNMDMRIDGITDFSSGTMPMYLDVVSGVETEQLSLRLGGNSTSGNLNLRIRGF